MKAGIPPDLDLDGAYIIRFTAVSATTGAVVSGVNVSQASLLVRNVTGGTLTVVTPPGEIDWLNLPQDGGA
jgi:hypothetical protein